MNTESQSVQLGCVVTLVLVIVTALHVLIWNQSQNSEECKYTHVQKSKHMYRYSQFKFSSLLNNYSY